MIKRVFLCCIAAAFLVPCIAHADELELIFSAEGDIDGERMCYGICSPGDLNGDGYSEIMVASIPDESSVDCPECYLIRVFNGGDPPNAEPIRVFQFSEVPILHLLPDILGDSFPEFCVQQRSSESDLQVFVDCGDTYTNVEPDFILRGANKRYSFGRFASSGNFMGGVERELVVTEPRWHSPFVSKFHFYETGSTFDTSADYSVTIDNQSVWKAESIGDINGDGFDDFSASTGSNTTPSYLYIFYGSTEPDSIADHVIPSPWNDNHFGSEIVPLGDINIDGYDDLLVINSGRPLTLFYGGSPFDTIPLRFDKDGETGAACGDLNGDGWEDIAIGNPAWAFSRGRVYVYYGGNPMDTIVDIVIDQDDLMEYPFRFGISISSAGDFNGDGIDDLAVGGAESPSSTFDRGLLLVFSGIKTPTAAGDDPAGVLPEDYAVLHQNYPNPFNSSTKIDFELKRSAHVELAIYNVLGQEIVKLVDGNIGAGEYAIIWNGEDESGHSVPSGIYLYSLTIPSNSESRKMMYLK